jgi:hypothetical protein
MTVYVVPCGVSILDGLISKADQGPRDAKPKRLVKSAADLGGGVLARADDEVCTWWADNATALADEARLLRWDPRALSAETNGLAASSGLGRLRELLDRRDRVLLLASDTGRGVAAALYVAQHIAGPALPRVAYLTTPDELTDTPLPIELAPGTLTVVRLRGLNPRLAQGRFVEAVAGIGRLLRAALNTGDDVEVHLTGGFKVTLLHTLAMTEVLYSLAEDRVRACYVFEDSDDPHATVTPIGMRRFAREDTDDMRRELAGIRDCQRDGKPGGDRNLGARTFEGLAWTERDGLNAFGYGYLAVLGERLTPGRPGPTGP